MYIRRRLEKIKKQGRPELFDNITYYFLLFVSLSKFVLFAPRLERARDQLEADAENWSRSRSRLVPALLQHAVDDMDDAVVGLEVRADDPGGR